MDVPSVGFQDELRISPRPVLIGLGFIGSAIVMTVSPLTTPAHQLLFTGLGLLVILLAIVAWRWEPLHPTVSGWVAVLTLAALIFLAWWRSDEPVYLTLLALPTVLAYLLLGWSASFGAACLFSVVTGACLVASGMPALTAPAIALVSLWGAFGLTHAAYHRINQLCAWVWGYYQEAQQVLDEARDRRAEVQQALESALNANRQLALANERIAMLRAIAENAQKAKAMFVANVSHEFRTPLNMITGLVDLMISSPGIYDVIPSPKMREDLAVVYRNCQHLSKMINDVLDLTRMESGYLALHREWVDLRDVVEDSVTAVRPLQEKKGLFLTVNIPADVPRVYCDRTRVQQVILNLISNAARFTECGGICVEVQKRACDVLIRVTDTGPGIRQEDLEVIFEPFCQGTAEPWRQKGGAGLGLSISRQFIRLHGGQMWVESQLGLGTSFYFTLPISAPAEPVAKPGHQVRSDWVWRESAFRTDRHVRPAELTVPRCLVYDEAGTLHTALAHYAGEAEFVNVRDLGGVAELLRACPAHLVLANAPSPQAAPVLTHRLKNEASGIPVVVCAVPPPAQLALEAGAMGHLVKPVTRNALQSVIERLRAQGRPVRQVVVVDDDPDTLHLFERMLRMCDAELDVTTLSTPRDALEVIRRLMPDLLLLDIVMPGMTGWEILHAMRDEGLLASVATYFVSAQDPTDQPATSPYLMVALGNELSVGRIVRWSLGLAALMLRPERAPDSVPAQTARH
jgi:signal transduction histidine kinase/CheY-like chemotaxis protein